MHVCIAICIYMHIETDVYIYIYIYMHVFKYALMHIPIHEPARSLSAKTATQGIPRLLFKSLTWTHP